ncbi:MAG TPA: hypothetical protein VFV38_17805 [Ktedonobacteraceae bacterium]|nr:hypothetical protein [Ktedonobacteraceae bacterium]
MARKASIKETIKAATIARVTNKAGKFLGFLVKSNTSEKYYQVTCCKIAGECVWNCDCKAGKNGFANCKQGACCHVRACKEVCAARRELRKAAQQGETPAQAAVEEAERIVKQAPVVAAPTLEERRYNAPLNTGFQFLK